MWKKIIREFNTLLSVISQFLCKMHTTEERYYKVNRILLKTLGLWPYEQSYFTQIHKVVFLGLLLTFILVQLLVFITTQYSVNLLLKIFSIVFPTLFVTIKYCHFIIQTDSVMKMLERMRNDWRLLKDELEVDIIEKYFYSIQFSSIILIVIAVFCFLLFLILQFLPLILDVILPLNESRPFRIFIITEYFINQEKYIYIILLHEVLACLIAAIAIYGTFITMMTYIWHACALFKIASYRIEKAIGKSALAIFGRQYLFERIVHAVLIHQRAVKFAELITSNFMVLFAILIVVGVISLSINIFQITLINNSNFEDIFIIIVLIVAHISYMFIVNYGGQKVTDHGMKVFKATYNGLWYAVPLPTQKILLFIMQEGMINVSIGCGNLFSASLEGFASLTNAAVSYFMVIYSTR